MDFFNYKNLFYIDSVFYFILYPTKKNIYYNIKKKMYWFYFSLYLPIFSSMDTSSSCIARGPVYTYKTNSLGYYHSLKQNYQ